jgi:ribosome-binding factor A
MSAPKNSPRGSPRAARVAQMIQEEVSRLLLRGLKDPRLGGLITVTGAKVSPDLKEAVIYYSVFGEAVKRAETQKGLEAASAYLKREISQNVQLRYAPNLRFVFDESIERGDRIEQLLREAKEKAPAGE